MQRVDELHVGDLRKQIIPNSVAGKSGMNLPFRDWSPLLKSVHFQEVIGPENGTPNTLSFEVRGPINNWTTEVRFDAWERVLHDLSLNAREAGHMLLWGSDVRLHCYCPSFLFWGFQYILTQLDASIEDVDDPPNVRNPQLKGIACKHLIKTLQVLPAHSATIAQEINKQRRAIGLIK